MKKIKVIEQKTKRKIYKFKVLNKKNKWEAWTGVFKSKRSMANWFERYGRFHIINNSHTLGLFRTIGKKTSHIETFEPNQIHHIRVCTLAFKLRDQQQRH